MPLARADIRYIGKAYTKETTLVSQSTLSHELHKHPSSGSHLNTSYQQQQAPPPPGTLLQTNAGADSSSSSLSSPGISPSHHLKFDQLNISITAKTTPTNTNNNNSNVDNFKVWTKRTDELPYEEITINKMPLHLASHRHHLFCVDDEDTLVIYAVASTNCFEFKSQFKLTCLTNVRGLAVNADYVALSFADLPKKLLKSNKRLRASGVALMRREPYDMVVVAEPDKLLLSDEPSSQQLRQPIGVALSAEHAFVCDRELRCVLKVEIRTNNLVRKIEMPGGEPYKCAVNRNYLVVTDTLQHHLNIYEVETLAMLNNIMIEQPDGKNGPFGVLISDDNIIFVKNYAESQLTMFSFNLNTKHVFKRIKASIHGFAMLQCYNQILVVGTIEKKAPCKLLCYSNLNN